MLRYLTAGESHGAGLTAILDGFPSNVKLNFERIAQMMRMRKSGYGRGGRQKIEDDALTVLSGVRNGVTTGAPITLWIENKDYENWRPYMDSVQCDTDAKRLTAVRPGHADLTGAMKYGHTDARNVLERASARETAARVAVGAVCRELLLSLGVETAAHVVKIGGEADDGAYSFQEVAACRSELRVVSPEAEARMRAKIDESKAKKDTVGGAFRILVTGVKPGLGNFTQYDRKLDAAYAAALMSIQAVKGVEVGMGFGVADLSGSEVMDEIVWKNGPKRRTNRAGGIEGGMSNGEDVVLTCAMKPIPTLGSSLDTIDLVTGEAVKAAFERSDVCAVTAASVVGESAVCFETAKFILLSLGAENFTELERRWKESVCL